MTIDNVHSAIRSSPQMEREITLPKRGNGSNSVSGFSPMPQTISFPSLPQPYQTIFLPILFFNFAVLPIPVPFLLSNFKIFLEINNCSRRRAVETVGNTDVVHSW